MNLSGCNKSYKFDDILLSVIESYIHVSVKCHLNIVILLGNKIVICSVR